MLCDCCTGREGREGEPKATRRRHGTLWRVDTCESCGAAILAVTGASVRNSGEHLARLTQFGLATSGKPLLDRKREGS